MFFKQYKEKKLDLKTKTSIQSFLFNEKEIDTLKKMCLVCIRSRLVHDELNLNDMYQFYKHCLELRDGI